MAKVRVLRRIVTEDNLLTWRIFEMEESEMVEGEVPYIEPPSEWDWGTEDSTEEEVIEDEPTPEEDSPLDP